MGKLNKTTDEINSNLNWYISKTKGTGIKVDEDAPTFPWVDLIGFVQPNSANPQTSPTWDVFQTGVNALHYNLNDILDVVYHIPHDWVPNSDAELHVHWGNKSALVDGDTFTITPTVTYGDRDGVFGTPVVLDDITYTAPVEGLVQFSHPVTEVPLCRETPTSIQLDRSLINVDGVILVSFVVTSISITGELFIFTADIHHQTTGVGTKNNAAPFYGE